MVVCQLGTVEKDVVATEDEKVVTTPRTKTDGGVNKEYAQTFSSRSPFMGASASTQDSDLTDQETGEEEERGRN
jgi:hypothetical protein